MSEWYPKKQVINEMMAAIAHEESAQSSLVKVEATKIEAIVEHSKQSGSVQDLLYASRDTNHFLDAMVMKEWLLLKRLENLLYLDDNEKEVTLTNTKASNYPQSVKKEQMKAPSRKHKKKNIAHSSIDDDILDDDLDYGEQVINDSPDE
ncbi:hypothetical protein IC620_11145 [Hazenella sp. IB182357]|uniref:Uncharacterized protein n=1 Tax=Polycladospora coralii TaxID=2771432 RepID=A0A926NB48_9BACL|nr:hypothetical protein [Polycladospora coralii]MBD1372912.1 hypothetical protein [Polycladospora coralii]MBS7531031.1 hypothetical protein [Polycladospora coralii]